VTASEASKFAAHSYAATSLSGTPRALFFYGYSSWNAGMASNKAAEQDGTLSAALDSANHADGDLLSSSDVSVWELGDELSHNPGFSVGARLMWIDSSPVKSGHFPGFKDVAKLYLAASKKGSPEDRLTSYERALGDGGDGFIIIWTLKSGADQGCHLPGQATRSRDGRRRMEEEAAIAECGLR